MAILIQVKGFGNRQPLSTGSSKGQTTSQIVVIYVKLTVIKNLDRASLKKVPWDYATPRMKLIRQ